MESSMNSLLELHNIYYSYHTLDAETRALSDLSFSVQPGTFTAVVELVPDVANLHFSP